MKLKILSKYSYRVIYIAIGLTICFSLLFDPWYLILLIPYSLYLIKFHKDIIVLILIVILLYFSRLILFELNTIEIKESYKVEILHSIKHKENTSFIGKTGNNKIVVYLDQLDLSLKEGDILEVKAEVGKPMKTTIPFTFNYKNYLKSQNISYTMFVDSYNITSHKFSIGIIRHNISDYIDKNIPLSGHYVKTFIIADKSGFDQEFIAMIGLLGISHLFAVSGLHVGLLVLVVNKGYKKILGSDNSFKVIIPLLITYIIITNFSPSIVRASLMYFGIFFKDKYKLKISNIDVLSIIYILLLINRPYFFFNVGFTLSFLVTGFILLNSFILTKKNKNIQIILITFLAFVITLPILSNMNKEINLYTLIINIFFIMGMTYVILPIGYITFIFKYIDSLYYTFIKLYEYYIEVVNQTNIFIISIVYNSVISIMIYYYIIINAYKHKSVNKRLILCICIFVIFNIIVSNINMINPIKSVNMIDIYGDSILVIDSFDQCNILVDTGIQDDYDSVLNYIKGKGVKRLDYLILTHEHDDHMGERDDIINDLNVVHVVNSYNQEFFSDIECGSIKVHVYKFFKSYNNTNNESIVFSLYMEDDHYLFTGDMELEKEEEFVELYDIDVNYLKSGHHGSITSSSEVFLDDINAENVLISCYRSNLHGHPHDAIIQRYEDRSINIYRTDLLGTIEVNYFFGFHYKKYHMP